jgi:hypothetical protein
MKKQPILTLACFLSFLPLNFGQNGCLPDGITFSSQAEIDNFPANYPGCTMIEGDVIVQEVVAGDIVSLDSLYPLVIIEGSVGIGLFSEGNLALGDLNGLENLTTIGEELNLFSNPMLSNLSGLSNLTTIGNEMTVSENPTLTNLEGLNSLIAIGGNLRIRLNSSLSSLSGLTSLESIGGGFSIRENDALVSLNGMESLHTLEGYLAISQNDALTDFSGFPATLTSIEMYLHIFDNDALVSLNGMENLTYVDADLDIFDNEALISLSGLENLDYTALSAVEIFNNPNLATCEVQFLCGYLENEGAAYINSNAPGCNSVPEVEDACSTVSVDNLISEEAIQVFPNPTTGIVHFEIPKNTEWKVSVRDATGRMVLPAQMLTNAQVDLSFLTPGLYLLELQDDRQRVLKKVVVE